jgi:competence protein ComEC
MSMVEALTIGRREGLSRQLRNDYSAAGVAHVLALSGMHLGLLLTLLNFLIFRFLSYEWRQRTMLAVIPLLWVFTYVAGMPSSLVRATVMATFLQVGFAFSRQYIVLNALALAAILMLAADPLQLHNVGFQLSFLSMLGVALVFKPLFLKSSPSAKYSKPIIPKLLRIVRPCLTLIMMTVSTTLFTAPVVAYHFGQLPVYSLVTNLVVPPLVMLLMWGAIAWLLLFWWPEAQAVVAHGLDVLVGVQNAVVQTIAQWPAATIQLQPTAIVVLLYYLLLAAALLFLFKYIRSKSLTA